MARLDGVMWGMCLLTKGWGYDNNILDSNELENTSQDTDHVLQLTIRSIVEEIADFAIHYKPEEKVKDVMP